MCRRLLAGLLIPRRSIAVPAPRRLHGHVIASLECISLGTGTWVLRSRVRPLAIVQRGASAFSDTRLS